METEIKAALIVLLDSIKRADGPAIGAQLSTLDQLLERSRGKIHPQLVHFLEGRSYAKAVQWLGGDAGVPVGACGDGRQAAQ